MKSRIFPLVALLTLMAVAFSSCLRDEVEVTRVDFTPDEYAIVSQAVKNLPIGFDDYAVRLPKHMRDMGMVEPEINAAKATLGRVLFYDNKLSKNNSVNCSSCHHQELAFSDNKARSVGFDGQLTPRNSIPLGAAPNFESSYGGGSFFGPSVGFFWDERASSIHQQTLLTLADDIEMGMDLNQLGSKLSGEAHYKVLFKKAFGNELITADRVAEAIQEFLNSFVSADSRFDEGMKRNHGNAGSDFTHFNAVENLGKRLFVENCATCHGQDMANLPITTANNGLALNYTDQGVGALTNQPSKNGVFKVPFLRNVALTAPYMHDGRFATLQQVVEHYSTGIQAHPNLHFFLLSGSQPRRMNFSTTEKEALITFLHTLTDTKFTTAQRFSDPF